MPADETSRDLGEEITWADNAPPSRPGVLPQLPTNVRPGPRRGGMRNAHGTVEESIVRQNRALELRMAGATLKQIQEALGYKSSQGVNNAINRALERDTLRLGDARDEYRRITVARTERLLRALWPRALDGDLATIDRVLKVMERQARLLGLDAPTQVTITDETRTELHRLVTDLEAAITTIPGEVDDAGSHDGAGAAGRDQAALVVGDAGRT